MTRLRGNVWPCRLRQRQTARLADDRGGSPGSKNAGAQAMTPAMVRALQVKRVLPMGCALDEGGVYDHRPKAPSRELHGKALPQRA